MVSDHEKAVNGQWFRYKSNLTTECIKSFGSKTKFKLKMILLFALVASIASLSFLDDMYGAFVPLGQLSTNEVNFSASNRSLKNSRNFGEIERT